MKKSDDGDFVDYSDYILLLLELEKANAKITELEARIKATQSPHWERVPILRDGGDFDPYDPA